MREQRIGLFAGHFDRLHQARQVAVRIRPRHDIDGGILQQLLLQALRHAAQYAHHDAAATLLLLTEYVEPAQHALFRIVPHRAGVDQDQVGTVHLRTADIARLLQEREHHLAVVDVHLAAVGFNIYIHFAWISLQR